MKIKIVYFANLFPNIWKKIIKEQLDALINSELYNDALYIYMSVISDDTEIIKLKNMLNNFYKKIQLINIYKENVYEYPGIKTVYEISRDNDNEVILYFHSKGITSNQNDIRKYLFDNTIKNYSTYLNEFKNNNKLEVAGAFPNIDGFCYFNFFWTRSSYVRNYCSRPEITDNRFIWEVWLGNEFSRKKNIITYSPLIGYNKLKNSNEIWIATKLYKPFNYEPINELTVEITEPINEPIVEITEPINESTVEITEPINEPIVEITEPINESTVEITEPINESINESTVEITEPINKPVRINNLTNYKTLNKPVKLNNIKNLFTKDFNDFINKNKNKNKNFVNLSNENFDNNLLNYFYKINNLHNNLKQIKKDKNDLTLKEYLFNNIYKYYEQIACIYCNLNELTILEDLLHHIFINKINLLLKITTDITNYEYLLSYFTYNKNLIKIGNYIYLQPKNILNVQMIKKNMTIAIIGYNQYTYISNMVTQLKKYSNDIVIIDNNSTYKPLLEYYNNFEYSLLKMDKNYGHKVYEEKILNTLFGNIFIITDPDLELNPKLPLNFITNLVNISNKYKSSKVGFALEISSINIRPELVYADMPLKIWESRFWQNKINDTKWELYIASIDTTFCLINTNYSGTSIRVANNYTCKHLPWYINFHENLLEDEYDKYLENNISTNYWNDKFKLNKKKNYYELIKNHINFNGLLILGNNNLNKSFINLFKTSYEYVNIKTVKEVFNEIYNIKSLLNISLVYVNYNGLEENILEDLIYICYLNKIKLLINFNYTKWKNKNIDIYNNLLKQFLIYENNIIFDIKNLSNNLLFLKENINISSDVIKNNITVVIIGFNQYTYIKNMVTQIEKYTTDIVVIDNNSTFPKLLEYYEKEYKYTLLKMNKNYGHKVYEKDFMNYIIGDIFILTDPDLEFNKNLPNNFILEMINISNYFQAEKVGFALLIDSDTIRDDIIVFGKTIKEYEKQYWVCKYYYPNHEIYSAAIDTTFCLINKQNKGGHYRLAGNYLCKHLPWHKNFDKDLTENEYNYYSINNISTNYWKKLSKN
jgi:hypothetical protein